MQEKKKGPGNNHLVAVLIALLVLIIAAVFYWDRQQQRRIDLSQARMRANLLEDWGHGAVQQVQSPLQNQTVGAQPQTVGFGRTVSYKNIIARVAPSVVSVNVSSGLFTPGAQQEPLQAQNVWGGPAGSFGHGVGGNAVCPNCNTRVPCRRGIPACFTNCPKCGTHMRPEGASWFCPFQTQAQVPSTQNQDISSGFGGAAQYVWGGRAGGYGMRSGGNLICPGCGTTRPCRTGVPAYAVICPNCQLPMMRESVPGTVTAPIKTQQIANPNTPPANQQQYQAAGKGGSGVIVNSQGYVLTNHHVIHGAKTIAVTVCSGLVTKTYPADVIDEAPELDFAILKIASNGEVFAHAPIGNSSQVSVGDEVLAIGSPFGLQQSVTFGIISNTRRTMTVGNQTYTDFIQTDAPLNPGSSGGALVNVNGEVIGINTAIYSPTQAFSGIGFARPIDSAKAVFPEFIDTSSGVTGILQGNKLFWGRGLQGQPAAVQQELESGPWGSSAGQMQQIANTINPPFLQGLGLYPWSPTGGWIRKSDNTQVQNTQTQNTPRKPWLGIRTRTVDQNVRDFLGLPMNFGVLVMEVFDLSPCRSGGVKAGDVIIRVDNRSVKGEEMLWKLLNKKTVGDEIKLTVYRDGSKKSLTCVLDNRPTGIGIPTFVKPRERELPERPLTVLQAQAIAMTTPSTADTTASTGTLPSPLEQNAAGKQFIEGHWLGLEVIPLTSELATEYQIPQGEAGLLVDEVTLEAAESGILAGDMVQSIAGLPTPDLKAFFEATQRERIQEAKHALVVVSRRGKKMTFTMTARNANMLGFAQMEAAQPIQPGALRPHRYMGECTKCHVFMKTGGQLATDAGDILPNPPPITKNAQPPHRYRGPCATCHTIK